jgi:3-oxoacyl-[acyl-carrier-protein] synthase III
MRAQGLELGEVDTLVATASVPGFADGLATRLGVASERVAALADELAGAHTAAPAAALESVELAMGGTTLFVSAGAGITVAVALYRG